MRAVGKGLIELGLEPFHTVAILGHNDPAWHIRCDYITNVHLLFDFPLFPAIWRQFTRVVSQLGSTRQTPLEPVSISQRTAGLYMIIIYIILYTKC